MNHEYRLARLALIKDACLSGAIVAMLSIPLVIADLPAQILIPWLCAVLAIATWLGYMVYKESTLSYVIYEEGIIVRELGATERVKWSEIRGIRHRPFHQDLELYELVLKDGTRRKLNPQVGRQFYADLKRSLPPTIPWDDS